MLTNILLASVLVAVVYSSNVVPTLKLNSGFNIPSFGLGTWLGIGGQVTDDSVEKAVGWAIDAGYRHIDTAHIYNDEDQVGRAVNKKIADGIVKREDLFITTKLWNDKHDKNDVVPALRESLRKLNLDYVDLYLIHWPIAVHPNQSFANIDYLDTWQGMIQARDLGLAKSIGISNFNQQQIQRIITNSPVKPAALQVEINLNLQQPSLLEYCRQQNVVVVGYTPFGSLFPSKAAVDAPLPRVDDPALVKIANKYNKTVPQIALRYLVELGVIPIPKSVTKSRIEQNRNVFDFQLNEEERDQLKSYDKNYRTISIEFWSKSPYYPF